MFRQTAANFWRILKHFNFALKFPQNGGFPAPPRQTETRAYWKECDQCGWTGRPTTKWRPETNTSFNTPDIQIETGLTQCSITQSIHRDLGRKCPFRVPTRLLHIIGSFFYICISQGSVTTQLRCGGIFNNHFIANGPQNVPVKKMLKIGQYLVNIWTRTQWKVFLNTL